MITKEEYEKIGETLKGEAVYRSKKNGCICTEKDHSYLVLSTLEEIEEAGMPIIEDSLRNTEIWIFTGQRDYDDRPIFIHRRTGRRVIINEANEMQQAHLDYPWYEKSLCKEKR